MKKQESGQWLNLEGDGVAPKAKSIPIQVLNEGKYPPQPPEENLKVIWNQQKRFFAILFIKKPKIYTQI